MKLPDNLELHGEEWINGAVRKEKSHLAFKKKKFHAIQLCVSVFHETVWWIIHFLLQGFTPKHTSTHKCPYLNPWMGASWEEFSTVY